MRKSRKLDHLRYALTLADGPTTTGFEDIKLIHNCLPELDWGDIDLSSSLAGLPLRHPVIVNAITGGTEEVTRINAALADFARRTGTAMAVGSQYAAFEYPEVKGSYEIVRKINPDGIVFANLGAHATPEQARLAIEMIGADAIQIHLNAAQEIIMAEGERRFSGYLENIAAIVAAVKVPVIVKEVGCGIAREQATQLTLAGVRAIDVGGAGGTNFIAIEAARTATALADDFLVWGIPTVVSAIEVASVLPKGVDLVVSGGVRTPTAAVKGLVIGGTAVGIASPLIKMLTEQGMEQTVAWFERFLTDMKRLLLLLGARTVGECAAAPFVVTGFSREWLECRGFDIKRYGQRKKHG